MKRLTIYLLLFVLTYYTSLNAQNDTSPESERTLPSFMYNDPISQMGVVYKLPVGFMHSYRDVSISTMFWGIGSEGLVESEDKELFILFNIPYFHTSKDSVELSMFMSPERQKLLSPNAMHRNVLNSDIKNINYYKKPMPDIESHLTYYPLDKAKEYYNADSAFIFEVNLRDHPYRYTLEESEPDLMNFEKYRHCTAFMLHKKDRGFLVMYLYHTDNVAARLDDYLERLKGIFWFREE